ncbi:MAG: type IV pilus biogenesis/stability protein PilW [Cellvibrionaceae bacterium]
MNSNMRSAIAFIFLSLVLLLSGCVQTVQTNSNTGRIINKQKALDSYIALGMAYLRQGTRDLARRNFEKALEVNPRSHEAHNGMGLLYKLTGEIELSEKSFKRSLRENKKFSPARLNYGVFLYTQGRYQEAIDNFEVASQDLTYDRRALALAYVGQSALKLNSKVRAKSAFEHSLNVDNNLALAMVELAQIAFDEEDYSAAKQYIDRFATVSRPSSKSLWLGVQIERIFGNQDKEASYAIALKNLHPYSKEYLEYKRLLGQQVRANEQEK